MPTPGPPPATRACLRLCSDERLRCSPAKCTRTPGDWIILGANQVIESRVDSLGSEVRIFRPCSRRLSMKVESRLDASKGSKVEQYSSAPVFGVAGRTGSIRSLYAGARVFSGSDSSK